MKNTFPTLAALALTTLGLNAATITAWNFNSNPPDPSTGTGTTAPMLGQGIASPVGGISVAFAAGSPNDRATADNSGWSTSAYPAQGAGNKIAGVQFNVSTRGYSNITVNLDQRVSSGASRYFRFQYSSNGNDFVEGPVVNLSASNTFLSQTILLGDVPEANENPHFAFRL